MVDLKDTSDKRLDRQQSYQQFHLGVYISLVTLIIGGSIFGKEHVQELGCRIYPMVAAVIFLMLAGMCGGIVAAKVPEFESYDSFLETRIGFSWPGSSKNFLFGLKPKTWESFEHLLFWMAIISGFAFALSYWMNPGNIPT